jgi:hypothetical protein
VRVSRDDRSRKGPIPVADDDDDDHTVVDVGAPSLAAMAGLGASSDDTDTELDLPALERPPSAPPRPLPPPPRSSAPIEARNFRGPSLPHLTPIADEDDDDDATHVLPRNDATPSRAARPTLRDLSDDGMLPSDEATARLPAPRRLDAVPRITPDEADDRTLSRPVLKRASFIPSGEGSPARLLDEMGMRPSVSPRSPSSADDEHLVIASHKAPPAMVKADSAPVLSDDDMGAFLVIDAPAGATVFVDGVEKGQGRTIVNGIDPHARFAIRVHKAGYKPWSGTTSLDGMREAIVRPTLKKRD